MGVPNKIGRRTTILLTSFDIWLPHHRSNASDDLLEAIFQLNFTAASLSFLRKLPVDRDRASKLAIDFIDRLQPDVIICCGMAESRQQLSIESNARCDREILKTSVDLEKLLDRLSATFISHDAGKFVCEGLYYQVLNYLSFKQLNSQCIFVHVPVLKESNEQEVIEDFCSIVKAFSGDPPLKNSQTEEDKPKNNFDS
jgi:pyroglutamyl-peptidase